MSIAEQLTTIAENVPKVYEAGQKSEHDKFWDLYQENGARVVYEYAFSNKYWDYRTFTPKYDIKPTTASNMFRGFNQEKNLDLVEHLETLGVTLDFSQCSTFTSCFTYAKINRIGVIDTRSAKTLNQLFSAATIEQIDELILKEDGSQTFIAPFNGTSAMKEMTVTGVIGQNGFNAGTLTKLSRKSIVSIVNALSTTTSGLSVTLSEIAVRNAFETSAGAADGSASAEWTNLVAAHSNWTISLV